MKWTKVELIAEKTDIYAHQKINENMLISKRKD
jgi:hypothetical protein